MQVGVHRRSQQKQPVVQKDDQKCKKKGANSEGSSSPVCMALSPIEPPSIDCCGRKELDLDIMVKAMMNFTADTISLSSELYEVNNEVEAWIHCMQVFNAVSKGTHKFVDSLLGFVKGSEQVDFVCQNAFDDVPLMMPFLLSANTRCGLPTCGPACSKIVDFIPEFSVIFFSNLL